MVGKKLPVPAGLACFHSLIFLRCSSNPAPATKIEAFFSDRIRRLLVFSPPILCCLPPDRSVETLFKCGVKIANPTNLSYAVLAKAVTLAMITPNVMRWMGCGECLAARFF
jgi:hypothetical protein